MIFTFLLFFPQELTDPTDHLGHTDTRSLWSLWWASHNGVFKASLRKWGKCLRLVLNALSFTHYLIPIYHCSTKGDILNWTHQNNIRTNMTATILCCWISFAVVGDSELLISHPEMSPPLLSVTQSCPQLLNPNNTLTDDCACRSRIVPPSPPTTQPLVSCFRLNRPQTGDRPLVLLLRSYGLVCSYC